MHKFLFTFDVEDFINPNAIYALRVVLEMLKKYQLRAMFFITGHMAEKLSNHPEILELLKNHEIGFHSSGHSVRPTIPEYSDVKSYHQAYSISLERETSHINPLTGKVEGEGGIFFLQDLFNPKKIEAFRAPGMCWTPPHLEALTDLGIEYDFSSSVSNSEPFHYRGITFYPYSFMEQWDGNLYGYQRLFAAILKRKIAILGVHPSQFVNQNSWDVIYHKGNPKNLHRVHERPLKESSALFQKFELLLKQLSLLQRTKLIGVDPNLNKSPKDLTVSKNEVQNYYETSVRWATKRLNFKPKYVRAHFYEFFEDAIH